MATRLPENHAPFTVEEVLAATGGVCVRQGEVREVREVREASEAGAVGVCTDSRAVAPGNVFVALTGARFDGHAHAAEAAARGASIVVVSRPVELPAGARASVIEVADTTLALGALGRAHRRRWAARRGGQAHVVGITGSAGKTTTRRAVAALLSGLGLRVHATSGNLNNAVGIPLVLLGLRDEHEVAVVEIGTSSRGEIAHGSSLAEHDVAVLTLVAAAHTEGIGSVDDVGREKGEIFVALPPHGVAVANVDNAHAAAQRLRTRASAWLGYGEGEGADVRVVSREAQGLTGSRLVLELGEGALSRGAPEAHLAVTTPLLGVAGSYASAAAVSVALSLLPGRVTSEAVSRAFSSLAERGEGEGGRLSAERLEGGTVLIDDSYNANRASVVASLGAGAEIARAEGRRFFAVLGEMRELGAMSIDEHREVGRAAAALEVSCLVAVAGDAAHVAEAARAGGVREVVFVPDARSAVEASLSRLSAGDVVLVKGSRGVGLEIVASAVAAASRGKHTPP